MSINVWSYLAEYTAEREDILDAVDTVFSSGRLVLGRSVTGFEEEFAAIHSSTAPAECVGVDNGTNAIVLALRALGVGPGDEVVTVPNTAAPTVVAIDAVGATPVFVDVREEDYLMDVDQVPGVLTDRTRCLLPVHLYGQVADISRLRTIADERGIALLEDCAQAHGALQHGRMAGTTGDAAAYSFYPTKVLGAYGDAGAVVTARPDVATSLRRLRYYGMTDRYAVEELPGHNSRLDEVQAEILRRKLGRLDEYLASRRRLAHRYEEALGDTDLVLPAVVEGNVHSYYLYVARHPQRDRIIELLAEHGVGLNVSYRWPVHLMPGFAHLGYRAGSFPVAERLAQEIFSLPMYPSLTDAQQDTVITGLRSALASL
ncbi:DegT/DnrJ/EryC1/StrS family aminotransferase [Georgenia sp. MJ170]|uniref:DegT/DnrJ/EryC1/StrS family aminotransferase n=1 Tax=Georgenia sunbinii TaxID=3117728 RepID=UPI002F26CC18